jgi:inner membrane protein
MKKEKIVAIIVLVFNCLTNILMLLPSALFVFIIADGFKNSDEFAPFVFVGIPAIIFSYIYSIYFARTWFFKPYDQEQALLTWTLAAFHYLAFLAYIVSLFIFIQDLRFGDVIWLAVPLILPIASAFSGIYLNKEENSITNKNEYSETYHEKEKGEEINEKNNPSEPEEEFSVETKITENEPLEFPSKNLNQMQTTEPQTSTFGRFSEWLKESIVVKLLAIGFLVLILLIPNSMISDLISERQQRQNEVTAEVSKSWGGYQSVTGPILSIPYSTWTELKDDKRVENKHVAYFLPKTLNVDGDLPHQIRERSIFKVILYQAELTLNGSFESPDFESLHVAPEDIHWEQAKLTLGIGGMTGIKEMIELNWNGQTVEMEPGTVSSELLRTGVSAAVSATPGGAEYTFSVPIKLNGSEGIRFEPVGKSTKVTLRSTWPSPSFTGDFLPDEREISKDGFSATWQVLDLNRSYPQQWTDGAISFDQKQNAAQYDYRYNDLISTSYDQNLPSDGATLAVRLVQPVNEYLKNTRSAKYAILVIGLTFLLYLFFEVLQKLLIHPFQYFLVGLAITVFYLLLLSLSEHFGFNLAYLVSAVATIGLITGYSWSFLGMKRLVLQLGGLLIAIYGFIFVLLQLEDYALLVGSIGVFMALAIVMYSSRKVDWYNLGARSKN